MAVPNLWRTKRERYSMVGQVCSECCKAVFPARRVCPHCHASMIDTALNAETREFQFAMPILAALELKVAADD